MAVIDIPQLCTPVSDTQISRHCTEVAERPDTAAPGFTGEEPNCDAAAMQQRSLRAQWIFASLGAAMLICAISSQSMLGYYAGVVALSLSYFAMWIAPR